MKYPVQIPVPSDLTIIVGDRVSEELERRYKTCKEKKVGFLGFLCYSQTNFYFVTLYKKLENI